jgi:hypothetical protein
MSQIFTAFLFAGFPVVWCLSRRGNYTKWTTTRVYARVVPVRCARGVAAGLAAALFFAVSGVPVVAQTPTQARYESAQVDKAPEPKKPVRVKYPSSARKKGGEITLRFLVTKEGTVKEMMVIRFTHDEMVEPAYSAYESAVYNPGMKDGKAVDTWVEITDVAK